MPAHIGKLGRGRTLAILLLPCMSFYAARILGGMVFSETGALYGQYCQKDSTQAMPARLPYTGNDSLDNGICVVVAFIHEIAYERKAPLFSEFSAAFGPSAVIPFIEMRRAGYRTSIVSASMLVLGVLYQLFSGGVIFPLWWTVHFLSSGLQTVPLHPHYVEGTLIGYLLGFLVVSVALAIYRTVTITIIWQLAFALIVLTQILYLGYQHYAGGDAPECSHDVLQLIHITNFCWSAITHAYTLFQILRSPVPFDSFKHTFYPTFSPSSLRPIASVAQEFAKWDIIFISSTTLFVGVFPLRGTRQKLLAVGWFILGSLGFGMGAALSGIWMWREKVLEEDRRVFASQSKKD